MQIANFDALNALNALNDLVISLPNELRHLLRTQQIFQQNSEKKKAKVESTKRKRNRAIDKDHFIIECNLLVLNE